MLQGLTKTGSYIFSWGVHGGDCFEKARLHSLFFHGGRPYEGLKELQSLRHFTITELKNVCDLHAQTTIEEGISIFQWHEILCEMYSELPGTRKYHDFFIAPSYDQTIVMNVRESYSCGLFIQSPLKNLDSIANDVPTSNYKETQFRTLFCPVKKFKNT